MDIANKADANGVISRDDFDQYFIEESLLPSEAVELEKKFSVAKFTIDLKEDPVWVDLTSIKVYLNDMRNLLKENPPLTACEERDLSYIVLHTKKEDFDHIQARNTLVERNLPFAYWMAKKFEHRVTSSLDFMDLIQESNLGLTEAAETYDGTKETRFTTYAYWWILSSIHRALVKKGYAMQIPARYPARYNHLRTAQDNVYERLQGLAPLEEVVKEHNKLFPTDPLSLQLASEILRLYPNAESLDEPIFDDNEDRDQGFFLESELSTEEIVEEQARRRLFIHLVRTELTDKERIVIEERYGLNNGGVEMLQRTLADKLGVKPQRISALQKSAEEKLARAMKKVHFEELLSR